MPSHSERSEAESKNPVEVTLELPERNPATSLGMTGMERKVYYGSES